MYQFSCRYPLVLSSTKTLQCSKLSISLTICLITKQLKKQSKPRRRYPEDEAKYPWLSLLLNAFHIVDEGIKSELKKEETKRNQKVTCRKGCSNCCLKNAIDFNELEIAGVSWYASEKLQNPVRQIVKKQLLNHQNSTVCPFLADNECSIYPVRPFTCRIFFIFGTVCSLDENAFLERFHDIWSPSELVTRESTYAIMPHFGIKLKDRKQAFEKGFLANASREMHELDLSEFCKAMDLLDKSRSS